MASFNDETTTVKAISPITIHAEWKGWAEKGFFEYYDKDLQENKKLELKDFVIIKTWYKISGFDERTSWGIWSNEINGFDEELYVSTKSGLLTSWLYKEIKMDVNARWGNLYRVLTVLSDWELISLSMKGSAFWSVSKILDGEKEDGKVISKPVNFRKNSILFTWFEDAKKGAVKYRVPVFTEWSELTADQIADAKDSANIVDEYYNSKKQSNVKASQDKVEEEDERF